MAAELEVPEEPDEVPEAPDEDEPVAFEADDEPDEPPVVVAPEEPEVEEPEAGAVADPPANDAEELKQLLSPPDWMVNGAEFCVAPVESRMVRPTEVPDPQSHCIRQ